MGALLRQLIRYPAGEPKVWSVLQMPTVAEEDRRQFADLSVRTLNRRTSTAACRARPSYLEDAELALRGRRVLNAKGA